MQKSWMLGCHTRSGHCPRDVRHVVGSSPCIETSKARVDARRLFALSYSPVARCSLAKSSQSCSIRRTRGVAPSVGRTVRWCSSHGSMNPVHLGHIQMMARLTASRATASGGEGVTNHTRPHWRRACSHLQRGRSSWPSSARVRRTRRGWHCGGVGVYVHSANLRAHNTRLARCRKGSWSRPLNRRRLLPLQG